MQKPVFPWEIQAFFVLLNHCFKGIPIFGWK